MSDEQWADPLHLPDLSIRAFLGIESAAISRLGRVTLLAGKNGLGKTTVLDAVRVYATRGRLDILAEVLKSRNEFFENIDDGEIFINWKSLFHGRNTRESPKILIGPKNGESALEISANPLRDKDIKRIRKFAPGFVESEDLRTLRIRFKDMKGDSFIVIPERDSNQGVSGKNGPPLRFFAPDYEGVSLGNWQETSQIPCEILGPDLIKGRDLARFWDEVLLTPDETRAVDAIKILIGDDIERVGIIGEEHKRRSNGRRVIVKMRNHERPVPLKSLGDGATRLFGIGLALANSRNGFLLVDEVENGLHHSAQRDFWKMVLQVANKNNVQVLATTHSSDCVFGFARAAIDVGEKDAALVRLDKDEGGIRVVEYNGEDLRIAVKHGIEVR